MAAKSKRIRVIPELRNYHLANLEASAPADVFFFRRKYDLNADTLPDGVSQVSFPALLGRLATSRAHILEIWEPLWVRLLPKHAIATLVWKCRPLPGRRCVVSYAMENNDPASLLGGRRVPPPIMTRFFTRAVGRYIQRNYTKLAFASDGSRELYHSLPGVVNVESRTILNLPSRGDAVTPSGAHLKHTCGLVVMVGRMEERKGLRELMEAWPDVERHVEDAQLLIVGDGPLSDTVELWCNQRADSRRFLGKKTRLEILRLLSGARVTVLPSVREGRWREQIGLPIHEGLLAGTTIVTSDETGLADWLDENGHVVVPVDHFPGALADGLIRALTETAQTYDQVQGSLPVSDGRLEANHWLNDWTCVHG